MDKDFIAYVNKKIDEFNSNFDNHQKNINAILISTETINVDEIMKTMLKIDTNYLSLCKEFDDYFNAHPKDDKKAKEFTDAILSEISETLLNYKGLIIESLSGNRTEMGN